MTYGMSLEEGEPKALDQIRFNDPKEPEPQIKQLTNKQTGATSKRFWSHCEEETYDAIP